MYGFIHTRSKSEAYNLLNNFNPTNADEIVFETKKKINFIIDSAYEITHYFFHENCIKHGSFSYFLLLSYFVLGLMPIAVGRNYGDVFNFIIPEYQGSFDKINQCD